jgi:pleiotropic regulator 1
MPGSIVAENSIVWREAGIFDIKFDRSGLRMITAECDKSIKIWKEDETATPETHPIVFSNE